jgi:ABC-type Fe3+/spermidine/putrescine transport system ATPase subunit
VEAFVKGSEEKMGNELVSIFPEKWGELQPDPDAAVWVRGLTKSYDSEHVLDDVSFSIPEGQSLVLLGHSGSGKSTTMRLIAGLEVPDSGEIYLHGRRVEQLRARDRKVGVIFQNYALFPRMTVAENIDFGLKIRKINRKERAAEVDKMLDLVGLTDQRDKHPWQISGGQQQRVAIARALAYRPEVLLFDESFSALDPQIRVSLRRDIRDLLRRLRVPALFITHDQEEAMELGDQIAILNRGRLEQIGTPDEVYNDPQTEFVATFLGAANVIAGKVERGTVLLDGERVLSQSVSPRGLADGDGVKVIFRPEDVLLTSATGRIDATGSLGRGEVIDVSFTGATESLTIRLVVKGQPVSRRNSFGRFQTGDVQHAGTPGGIVIKVLRTKWEARRFHLAPGDPVWVGLKSYKILQDETSPQGSSVFQEPVKA